MSITPVTPQGPEAAPPPGTSPCPRCGELLAHDQDWCLRCGDPARTVIAATPRWRRPIAAILALGAIALGVLTAAFIGLTDDDPPPPRTITTTTTLPPGATPPPGVQTVPETTAATTTTPPTTTTTTACGGIATTPATAAGTPITPTTPTTTTATTTTSEK